MYCRLYVIMILVCLSTMVMAQNIKRVHGEYIYHAPENVTLEEAKHTALDRAKIQAIADAFGTIVTQNNSTIVKNENGHSSTDFFSWGGSEVKGEWIETLEDPQYDISYAQEMLIVKVSVDGKAREITSSNIDIDVRILRNGTDLKYESSEFKSGDDLYLRFVSPVDGYLCVYLLDYTSKTAYCLLPYRASPESVQNVVHDKPYLLFSAEDAPTELADMVDEYTMTCDDSQEINDIYIIFSPNRFTKTNNATSGKSILREL